MDTTQTFPPEPLDHLRPQFEAAIKTLATKQYGYSDSDAMLKTLKERNRNGNYAVEWVRGAWGGFCVANADIAAPLAKHNKIPLERGLYWYFANGADEPRAVMIDHDKWVGKFKSFNGAEQSWLREGEYLVGPQHAPASL